MGKFKWKRFIFPQARAIFRADAARDSRNHIVAAQAYGDIIRRWGASHALLMQFGNALKDSGNFREAERAYLDALAIRATEADTFLQYGHLMKISGNPGKAEEFYRRALELEPSLTTARHEIDAIGNSRTVAGGDTEQHRLIIRTDMPLPASITYYRLVNNHRWRRG